MDRDDIKRHIKAKVVELAALLGADATQLADADLIPATGFLDSAAILELVVWYEAFFGITLRPDEITIDNLGTLDAMADFALARRSV
jgi:acyl carrier protein